MSQEEITSLYHAIKNPEEFKNVFEALGLSETKFQLSKRSPFLLKSEKDEIIKQLFEILLNLDITPELPDFLPKTTLEALISPRDLSSNSSIKVTFTLSLI